MRLDQVLERSGFRVDSNEGYEIDAERRATYSRIVKELTERRFITPLYTDSSQVSRTPINITAPREVYAYSLDIHYGWVDAVCRFESQIYYVEILNGGVIRLVLLRCLRDLEDITTKSAIRGMGYSTPLACTCEGKKSTCRHSP